MTAARTDRKGQHMSENNTVPVSEPTEGDRARARQLVRCCGRYDEEVAAALAAERDRTTADLRARVEALAEEYRAIANEHFAAGFRDKGYDALEHAARLRALLATGQEDGQ